MNSLHMNQNIYIFPFWTLTPITHIAYETLYCKDQLRPLQFKYVGNRESVTTLQEPIYSSFDYRVILYLQYFISISYYQ